MEIVYDRDSLARYMRAAVRVSPAHPVLIDKFLEDAIEVDVDAVSDGREVVIGGIMEHIERARAHRRRRMLPPPFLARRRRAEGDPPPDGGAGTRARCGRPHERPVRRQG